MKKQHRFNPVDSRQISVDMGQTLKPMPQTCEFCGKQAYGLMQQSETNKKFHFDCYVKYMIKEEIQSQLKLHDILFDCIIQFHVKAAKYKLPDEYTVAELRAWINDYVNFRVLMKKEKMDES